MAEADNNQENTIQESTEVESQEFVTVLSELAGFKEFFQDNDSIAPIVHKLSEETGFPKLAVRGAIKKVAPFIISKVAKTGEAYANTALARLNDKLAQYAWYRGFCQRLLDTLKSHSGKQFSGVVNAPDPESIQALLDNQAHWHNLKPEQQGLTQLLLGQAQQYGVSLDIEKKLDALIRQFDFQPELDTPDYLILAKENAELASPAWLTYGKRQAKLIGRDTELKRLAEFYRLDNSFAWWCITGAGGAGKNRLALESMLRLSLDWEKGFLPSSELKSIVAKRWQPSQPTLLVLDYGATQADKLADSLDYLIRHQQEFEFPLRLVVLERYAKGQDWWQNLVSTSDQALTRQQTLHTGDVLELSPIFANAQLAILQSYLQQLAFEESLPESDEFINQIQQLSDGGKPLYLGMVAIAINQEGVGQVRNWGADTNKLLDFLYQKEKRNWHYRLAHLDNNEQNRLIDLLLLSTFCQGLWKIDDEDGLVDALFAAKLINKNVDWDDDWMQVQTLAGHQDGYLLPDIIAEFILLNHYKSTGGKLPRKLKQLALLTYQFAPVEFITVLERCATDFSEHPKANQCWLHLLQKEPDSEMLLEAGNSIAGQLLFKGKGQQALEHWLPAIMDSGDSKEKASALVCAARILKLQGDLDTALGYLKQSLAIRQEIGDRQGEGTTLNNIAANYNARGDYGTALTYLKQSLAIQQEIGDRQGEGTTLNNISQIYDARGDYANALTYLKQSLAICQEIGHRQGEGTTLNNTSQIYDARGDYANALTCLKQSLAIQQEIGDRQGEGVTLNNIALNYNARGDLDTALTHLQQSLAIRREIGDRQGEGTNLNNISQIYDARGEYDTALTYLHQSLTIQQEIGYSAGLCVTLINMGHMHKHNKEIPQAFACWLNAYGLAKAMGLTQALNALENLAPQLGMEDGLADWERLWQKQQAQGAEAGDENE